MTKSLFIGCVSCGHLLEPLEIFIVLFGLPQRSNGRTQAEPLGLMNHKPFLIAWDLNLSPALSLKQLIWGVQVCPDPGGELANSRDTKHLKICGLPSRPPYRFPEVVEGDRWQQLQKWKDRGGDPDRTRDREQEQNAEGRKSSVVNNSGNYELEKENCDVF